MRNCLVKCFFVGLTACWSVPSSSIEAQAADPQQGTGHNQNWGPQENFSNQNTQSGQRATGNQQAQLGQNPSLETDGLTSLPVPQRPFELSPEEAEYLDKMLDHWQASSERVKQYVCHFERYQYDSESVDYRDPQDNRLAAATVAVGELRFAAPDRGFYETKRVWAFAAPPEKPGETARYDEIKGDNVLEKWICDGRYVYEFDFSNKILYEEEIPASMRGGRIIDSPLPFVFGAKKDELMSKYWVRPIAQSNPDEYHLEAYPKRIEDARAYKKVEIVLAKEDFLPKAIHVYMPQYDPQRGNFESRYFLFENRNVNSQVARFQDFLKIFVRPQTPPFAGWERKKRSPLHEERQAVNPGQSR